MFLEQAQKKQSNATLRELVPSQKNIDIRLLVVNKIQSKEIKSGEILTETIVADSTGKIQCNLFGEVGTQCKEGDILYLIGAYCSLFHGRKVLYTSVKGAVYRLRDFFMLADIQGKNFSDEVH